VCWEPKATGESDCQNNHKGTWKNSGNANNDYYCEIEENGEGKCIVAGANILIATIRH
jgi:hypothetical protein